MKKEFQISENLTIQIFGPTIEYPFDKSSVVLNPNAYELIYTAKVKESTLHTQGHSEFSALIRLLELLDVDYTKKIAGIK